jgi:anti-sigma factor RsiW
MDPRHKTTKMMNCTQITNQLDDYLDGILDSRQQLQFQQHLQDCADCRAQKEQIIALQEDLKLLPVAKPDPAFFELALDKAVSQQTGGAQRVGMLQKVVGLAVAASVFALVMTSILPGTQDARLAGVTMTLNETRTVQISLNAERDLQGAKLSIQLPDGVEMKGFPGRRIVSWNADLQQGMNILPLPLVAVAVSEGRVIARLEHDNKSRELEVQLNVRGSGNSRLTVPAANFRERA